MTSGEGAVKAKAPTRKKKKRISKHVLLSKAHAAVAAAVAASSTSTEDHSTKSDAATSQGADAELVNSLAQGNPAPDSSLKRKKKLREKDPSEALAYLQSWKGSTTHTHPDQPPLTGNDADRPRPGSVWKFNKNTQSWLVRHMYEPDKVSKHAFELLLDYLRAMHEGPAKVRMLQDAHRRVVRYKKQPSEPSDAAVDEKDGAAPALGKGGNDETGRARRGDGGNDNNNDDKEDDDDDDDARWRQMSDHDRRKEYKRARRVLELFQAPGNEGEDGFMDPQP
jgi:WKF domain